MEKLLENNSQTKQQEKQRRQRGESRNLIGTDQAQSLYEKSEGTRKAQTSLLGSFLSKDWSEKSHQSTKMTCDFSHQLSARYKKQQKDT